ncbi:Crp/Fnr family transcriptional regulator [Rathayibacter soli]|uniref:Crp/Fnr family transcriptional regulator n=1 Tax=Rathayibacter soli TaxID=3144168 RepID=UPI0027E4508F|nr:Crp/Fnr family transcriptional regulator [Glaciibacter superstes]
MTQDVRVSRPYPERTGTVALARVAESCSSEITAALSGPRPAWSPEKREEAPLQPTPGDPFSCLREVDLFADLSADEIDAMNLMIPATHYRAGELVFSQSQPVNALFILKSGRVRIFRVTEDGKALTMAILEAGSVFGEMLQLGQRMYDNYAEAIEESTICRLNAADVERYFLSDPRIATRVARLLGEEIARLEERLTDLALRPLPARTASTLVKLARTAPPARFGHGPVISLTHEQLAGLLGATREATSKVMVDFATQNLIRQARGRITILDLTGLGVIARRTS